MLLKSEETYVGFLEYEVEIRFTPSGIQVGTGSILLERNSEERIRFNVYEESVIEHMIEHKRGDWISLTGRWQIYKTENAEYHHLTVTRCNHESEPANE